MAELLRHEPPGWNPPGDYQLCYCEHEQVLHGNGEFWTSCQTVDCDCSQFRAEYQSPEVKAAFRREMDAGERCRACGQKGHDAEYHTRPIYGGPVCHFPDCGHECSHEGLLRRLYRRVFKK